MRRILVTGAGGSAASNFVHSLRLSGEEFHVVGTDASKYHLELSNADETFLLPRADDSRYLEELQSLVETERIQLVHPQPDPEVLAVSTSRAELGAATFLPRHETIALCQDKAALNAALARADLPTPVTMTALSLAKFEEVAAGILGSFERAWVRARHGAGARASLPVTTAAQAAAWVRYWGETRGLAPGDFMVSEFLPGREFAFQSLWSDGELVTSAARERVEYLFGHIAPSGQTSTPAIARTVHRQDVNDLASRAVRAVDSAACGVFCVDLKENGIGQPLITEINAGRFFTTSNFLAVAGANMPFAYAQLALGERLEGLPRYDAVASDLYWVRMVDMGFKLVRNGEWRSSEPRH